MAHQSPKRRPLILIVILFLIFSAGTFFALKFFSKKDEVPIQEMPVEEEKEEIKKPEIINLQSIVDDWTKTLRLGKASVGVYIYDLDNEVELATFSEDERFQTASLYKLFVVYEGYREVEAGELDPEKVIYGGYTVQKCLDLAIRQSHSGCAETLHSLIGRDKLANVILSDFNLKNSSAAGLYSTPKEIAEMMHIYYMHENLSENSWNLIKDSMLNQPPTNNGLCAGACDWRQGLPSGFSAASVYNKVGWQGNGDGTWYIYADAAIVELLDHHYIISVMANWVYPSEIANLGKSIESTVISSSNN